MAEWPPGIPVFPLLEGFSYQPANTLLASEVESGPPKVRRRTTAGVERWSGTFLLTAVQTEIFRSWFENDLAGGALPFDQTHPVTDAWRSMRFDPQSLPSYSPVGNGIWRVDVQVLVLP